MPCEKTGQHGAAVRILPKHPDLANPYELGLIFWEKPDETPQPQPVEAAGK